jgi:enoyl-CoA hydratase
MTEVVLVDVTDRVATITLNRPEARNALNTQLRSALPKAVAECDARDDVDVLILTGADPVFCAGLDLKELGQSANEADDAAVVASTERRGPLPPTAKPLIGAINGAAITGGFELALNCDFLIASEHARFADTHTRVGIQPGWGLTVLLAEAVGVRRAKELSATGNFLDAQTALTWGLVNHVVPHGELLSFCRSLAADIVSNEQDGVRHIVETYDAGNLTTRDDWWNLEIRRSREWMASRHALGAAVESRREAVMQRGRKQVG